MNDIAGFIFTRISYHAGEGKGSEQRIAGGLLKGGPKRIAFPDALDAENLDFPMEKIIDTSIANRRNRRFIGVLILGLVLLFLFSGLGICLSSGSIPAESVFRIVLSNSIPGMNLDLADIREVDQRIVWLIRTPRVILAGLVGAMLAVAGVQMQGLFRNPLAAPGLVGTSQGASLGGAIAIATGLGLTSIGWVPLFSFIGAFLSLFLIYLLAHREGETSVAMLLLAGVALNFLLSALVSLVISWKFKDYQAAVEIVRWLLGGLKDRSWDYVTIAFCSFIPAFLLSTWYARDLDLMLEGEETAQSLGVETEKVTWVVLLSTALLTGAAVSVSGVVSFVGLMIPHLLRLIIGPGHRNLNIASAMTGAWFLIAADILSRTLIRPEELPLGIITSLIGAPFFLFLLVRQRKELEIL
ncbi:MAG: iron ABC transporter permease [Candidatus Omnitrophica bacterium]|nr:iron ABC transporter permease [Candidatus Omnitrophota bacterium]MCB9767715.1 iron ABC transporter permease [Candidatus Omnitrophota bacterium]MCB9782351.1 iron ABC transporter permease [Candidatus Omnitrophota bacterium]